MKKFYFVAAGGGIGALFRFLLKSNSDILQLSDSTINTAVMILFVNLAGCLLLGTLNAIFSKTERLSSETRLAITTGFVGAFTTFSTFCKECLILFDKSLSLFFIYLSISIFAGILFVYLGHLLGIHFIHPIGQNLISRSSMEQ